MKSLAAVEKYPYGVEFQRKLLAIAFREPHFAERYGYTLSPNFFDASVFRHLAKILTGFATEHMRTPSIEIARDLVIQYCIKNRYAESVRDELLESVAELVSENLKESEWVRERAQEFAQAQALRDVILRGARMLRDGEEGDYGQLVSDIQRAMEMGLVHQESMIFGESAPYLQSIISDQSGRDTRIISTGVDRLDHDMFGGISPRQLGVVMAPSKIGKLVADDTPVMTVDGWKIHGELEVGDRVFGLDGRPTNVVWVGEPAEADVRVKFQDGSEVWCHENHEWRVYDRSGFHRRWRTIETNVLVESLVMNGSTPRSRFQLPLKPPIQFPERDLPLPPYALGLWLGDGIHTKPCICHGSRDVESIQEIVRLGFPITNVQIHEETGVHYSYFGGPTTQGGPFRTGLHEAGVFGNKHIPDIYLRSSEKQRMELLAGLIDSDGHCDTNRRVIITGASKVLMEGVRELARSLGWRTGLTEVAPTDSGYGGNRIIYKVGFTPNRSIPTKLPRKKIDGSLRSQRRIGIVSAERVESSKVGRCIQVSNHDGIYLVGKEFIPTHNSHTLTSFGCAALRHGFGVHHYTIQDLREWEVAARYASNMTGIPSQNITTDHQYPEKIAAWLGKHQPKLVINYFPADTLTPAALVSHITSNIARTGITPDLIILDYADLLASGMKPTFNSAEKSEMMGWMYKQLLKMIDKLDAALWTAMQVAGSSWENEIITASAYTRSRQIIEHSHYVISLNQKREERKHGRARLYTCAFRRGEDRQVIPVRLNKALSRIEDDLELEQQRHETDDVADTQDVETQETKIDPWAVMRRRHAKMEA